MKRLLFFLLSLPLLAFAEGGLPNQPYIYVEGKAEIEKPADLVTLRFDVVTRNADEGKANQDVQAKAGKIFAILNNSKIAEKDVIAGDLRSEPEYEGDEESPRKRGKFLDYSVTRSFWVKVRDVSAFPKLVDELLALGEITFSSIDGGISNEKELTDQMWDKALADARQRAEKTVKAAAMKLDSVFAISPIKFPSIQGQIFGYSLQGAMAEEVGPAKIPNPSQYRLAPISISQNIHVIYLISPVK